MRTIISKNLYIISYLLFLIYFFLNGDDGDMVTAIEIIINILSP
jgi:hypothetical protein